MRPSPRFREGPFTYHQEIEVEVASLTNQGAGVARVDGWVVFVPYALPGDRVRARVFRNHASYSEADLVAVLEPSPDRVEPVCPLFGECGGCQYQNLGYAAQLHWKQRQVAELLRHMAGIDHPVAPVVPSPRPYGYRSKITPHHHKARQGETGPVGFLRAGRRFDLVDVPRCPIAMEALNDALPTVRERARREAGGRRSGATLFLRATAAGVLTDPRSLAEEQVEGVTFSFLAGDFFQNNPFLLPAFTAHVRTQAAASGAPYLADAYCGSGLFALTAARAFREVAGIEISASAIAQATANAHRNGIGNARFVAGEASSLFAQVAWPGTDCAVVIDPPRRGTDAAFLAQLAAFGPRRVVYVSCNPATQMRDLKEFVAAGYRLSLVQPFDMFPQTKHLECVITFDRE